MGGPSNTAVRSLGDLSSRLSRDCFNAQVDSFPLWNAGPWWTCALAADWRWGGKLLGMTALTTVCCKEPWNPFKKTALSRSTDLGHVFQGCLSTTLFLTLARGVLQQIHFQLVDSSSYILWVLVKVHCSRSQFLLLSVVCCGAMDVFYVK